MFSQAELILRVISLVPGLISIFLETVWVPLSELLVSFDHNYRVLKSSVSIPNMKLLHYLSSFKHKNHPVNRINIYMTKHHFNILQDLYLTHTTSSLKKNSEHSRHPCIQAVRCIFIIITIFIIFLL